MLQGEQKLVRDKEILELWKVPYKSFLKIFDGEQIFVRDMGIFEL